jgi:hypothetical protein
MNIPDWVLFIMLFAILGLILFSVNKEDTTITPAPPLILAPTVIPPPEKQQVEFNIEPAPEPDINVDVWAPQPAPPKPPPPPQNHHTNGPH